MAQENAKEKDKLYRRVEKSFRKQNFLTLIGAELRTVEKGRSPVSAGKSWAGSRGFSTAVWWRPLPM